MKRILKFAALPILIAGGALIWLPRAQLSELELISFGVVAVLLILLVPLWYEARTWRRAARRRHRQLHSARSTHARGDEYNLREVVSRYVEPYRTMAARNGVELVVAFADSIPEWFTGTGAGLEKIISKQLNDIVRATKKGYIVLQVKCHKEGDGRARLRFRVDAMPSYSERKVASAARSLAEMEPTRVGMQPVQTMFCH